MNLKYIIKMEDSHDENNANIQNLQNEDNKTKTQKNENSLNNNNINIIIEDENEKLNINENKNEKIDENNNIISENNSIKNQEKKFPKLIWMDFNINGKENLKYKNELKELVFLIECNSIEQGLEEIKKIKFERVILMLTKTMFIDFINLFEKEKKEICCSLNIIVFTKKSGRSAVEEICKKNEQISSGYIFDKTNIFHNFKQIKKFITQETDEKLFFSTHFEIIDENNKIYYESIANFEKIENFEELILPIYFHKIIVPIAPEEIHNFNYYLSTSFEKSKKLISQLENMAEMPIEIICKYWAKIYTLESGKFYSILNNGLREKKFKLFLPFIKMMYEGVNKKALNSISDEELYSGGLISNLELEKLRNNLKENNNNNLPKLIYYFKSFKSFSKLKEKAEYFMQKAQKHKDENSTLIIFIITNNNFKEEFVSNAYIKEFSQFPKEEEVLFFPFSSFEVIKIEDENDHVNIYLNYLGKYKSYIDQKKSIIFRDIPITQFGKDILEMELINYKFTKFWEVEKVIPIINGNSNCILCLQKNIILFSFGNLISNLIKVYDCENNKNLLDINIHTKEINDLLKINEFIFISSSKDNTIKFIKLTDNYSNFTIIKNIGIHRDEVNQTIKLNRDNLYLSCSNDRTMKLFEFDYNHINNMVVEKKSISYFFKFLCVYELPNTNIISISDDGYLKFWEYKNYDLKRTGNLKGFKNCLHNCIFSLNENITLVGTRKKIIFLDINKMQKINKFLLNYNSYSICKFNKSIFLGLKNNTNSCLLFEYEEDYKNKDINFECIGKGRDICLEISYICAIDEKTIVTSNKNGYLKIWKEKEKKPKTLFIEYNSDYNFQEDYDSDNEAKLIITPNKENNIRNEIPGNDDIIPKNNNFDNEYEIINSDDNIILKNSIVDNFINKDNKDNNIQSNNSKNEEQNNNNINIINEDESKLNIIFCLPNGTKKIIQCEKNKTVEELLKIFLEKMNFDNEFNVEENLFFNYNAKKLKINDKTKIENIFYTDYSQIIVYDKKGLLFNNSINLKTVKGNEYKLSVSPNENVYELLQSYLENFGEKEEIKNIEDLKKINFEEFLIKISKLNK